MKTVLTIQSFQMEFRRAGRRFTRSPQVIAVDDLTPEEYASLKECPDLLCVESDVATTPGAADGQGSESKVVVAKQVSAPSNKDTAFSTWGFNNQATSTGQGSESKVVTDAAIVASEVPAAPAKKAVAKARKAPAPVEKGVVQPPDDQTKGEA